MYLVLRTFPLILTSLSALIFTVSVIPALLTELICTGNFGIFNLNAGSENK